MIVFDESNPPPSFPLCWDCRHVRGSVDFPRCGHPLIPPHDVSTGERPYASWVRNDAWMNRAYLQCDIAGNLFEPHPPRVSWLLRVRWRLLKWIRENRA